MRTVQMRYGIPSTYAASIFVRRTADFRFEVSRPMRHDASGPTVREAVFVFATWAEAAGLYQEPADFNSILLSQEIGSLVSTRVSPYRRTDAQQSAGNGSAGEALLRTPVSTNGSGQRHGFSADLSSISSRTIFANMGEVVRLEAESLVKGSPGAVKQTWCGSFRDIPVAIKYRPAHQFSRYCGHPCVKVTSKASVS